MSAIVDSVEPLDGLALDFGAKITLAWQKSIEGILEAGALLIKAKAVLPHGEFERMVARSCPFGARTAQMLMRISSNPVLSNTKHVSHLPNHWGTLAELAKFEPPELEHAIRNYWVKPEMTREDVGNLHRIVRKVFGHRVRVRKTRSSKPRVSWKQRTIEILNASRENEVKAMKALRLAESTTSPHEARTAREIAARLSVRVRAEQEDWFADNRVDGAPMLLSIAENAAELIGMLDVLQHRVGRALKGGYFGESRKSHAADAYQPIDALIALASAIDKASNEIGDIYDDLAGMTNLPKREQA